MVNLIDNKSKSGTQKFIKIYDQLKNQGPLDDEKIFEVALEQLNSVKEPKEFFMPAFARDSRIPAEIFRQNRKSEKVNAVNETQQEPTTGVKKQPKQSEKQKLEKGIDVKHMF